MMTKRSLTVSLLLQNFLEAKKYPSLSICDHKQTTIVRLGCQEGNLEDMNEDGGESWRNSFSCVRAGKVDLDELKQREVTFSEVLKNVALIIWSVRHDCWKIVPTFLLEDCTSVIIGN